MPMYHVHVHTYEPKKPVSNSRIADLVCPIHEKGLLKKSRPSWASDCQSNTRVCQMYTFLCDWLDRGLSLWSVIAIYAPFSWFVTEKTSSTTNGPSSIAIVGSGFSGICAGVQVKKRLGLTPQIFESSPDVGGVWLTTNYPDCAVDVPSHLYSFSFEPNPNWSQCFSCKPENLAYIQTLAQKYSLYDNTKFNTVVLRASWIEKRNQWKVEYQSTGQSSSPTQVNVAYFDLLISAVGPVQNWKIPEQFKSFRGPYFHTAKWDTTLDFRGKKVGVVGSGASAAQVVPHLQKVCKEVINYQRSPAWMVPKPQFEYPGWVRALFFYFSFVMKLQRLAIYFLFEPWYTIFGKHWDSLSAKWMVRILTRYMTNCCERHGRLDLAKILIPKYPFMCNAPVFSSDYLPALCQPNVKVKMGSIVDIQGQTISHSDGSKENLDILVLATGYDQQKYLGNMQIFGRDGLCLNEKWRRDYPATFQCIHTHGFPNFFMILGPNSFASNAYTSMIEIQVASIIRAIQFMRQSNLAGMEVKIEPETEWTQDMRVQLNKNTALTRNCNSGWKNEKGEVFNIHPSSATYYKLRTWRLNPQNFILYPKKIIDGIES